MRPNHIQYFLTIAFAAALRGTCIRRRVGAVLTKNGHIVSTGYNGAPPGGKHCIDEGCLMHNDRCIRTIHAEMNAVIQAKEKADTLFSTDMPCINCLKALLSHNKDIVIYYVREYRDAERDIFIADQGLRDNQIIQIKESEIESFIKHISIQ